jgi:exodeoxyribonuclease V alpha subunit
LGDITLRATVVAGAVLGDICFGMKSLWFSNGFVEGYRKVTGEVLRDPTGRPGPATSAIKMRDSMIELRKNFRFGSSSAMAGLSEAVREGRYDAALEILRQNKGDQIAWENLPATGELKGALRPLVLECWSGYLRSEDPAEMLKGFDRLRILCAVRKGPYGVEAVNGIVEEILREEGLIRARGPWYVGRPLMVTGNDYALRLFNGDVGIAAPDGGGGLRVYFEAGQAATRAFSPYRIPPHETVFATTVHKSQGSEFEEVLVILPERDVPILTRELLYTGITRAKGRATLWALEETIRITVSRRIVRASGLRDSLWGDSVTSDLSS